MKCSQCGTSFCWLCGQVNARNGAVFVSYGMAWHGMACCDIRYPFLLLLSSIPLFIFISVLRPLPFFPYTAWFLSTSSHRRPYKTQPSRITFNGGICRAVPIYRSAVDSTEGSSSEQLYYVLRYDTTLYSVMWHLPHCHLLRSAVRSCTDSQFVSSIIIIIIIVSTFAPLLLYSYSSIVPPPLHWYCTHSHANYTTHSLRWMTPLRNPLHSQGHTREQLLSSNS